MAGPASSAARGISFSKVEGGKRQDGSYITLFTGSGADFGARASGGAFLRPAVDLELAGAPPPHPRATGHHGRSGRFGAVQRALPRGGAGRDLQPLPEPGADRAVAPAHRPDPA